MSAMACRAQEPLSRSTDAAILEVDVLILV